MFAYVNFLNNLKNMIIKDLIDFGLNDKEAKAYLALLELEIAGVQEIAKVAGINRSSAYVTLESLKKRGLVSISDDKNVRQYVATSPEVILRLADEMATKQENIRKKIHAIVPDMKAIYKGTKKKPLVKVFEGREGLISAFEETLNNKEKVMRVVSSPMNLGPIMASYMPQYMKTRFGLGIKMFGIHPDDSENRKLILRDPKNKDIYALIPAKDYKFPADLAIYQDKIGYMSKEEGGLAIVIESKEIAEVMKSIFDLAFLEARRINKLKT